MTCESTLLNNLKLPHLKAAFSYYYSGYMIYQESINLIAEAVSLYSNQIPSKARSIMLSKEDLIVQGHPNLIY